MTKYRFLTLSIILAVAVTLFGLWAKIMHQSYARTVLTISTVIQGIAAAIGAWIIAGHLGNKKDR